MILFRHFCGQKAITDVWVYRTIYCNGWINRWNSHISGNSSFFFGSLETGGSGGIFLSQRWELGMIVFHDQVIEAVCAGHCLGRMDFGQKGTKSLDFFRKDSINRTQEYLHTLTGMGSGMKLIRSNGAQEKINS